MPDVESHNSSEGPNKRSVFIDNLENGERGYKGKIDRGNKLGNQKLKSSHKTKKKIPAKITKSRFKR